MKRSIELYQYLPDTCKVDRSVPKEAFLKNGRIKPGAQYRFSLYYENATLAYVLRSTSGDLPSIKEKDRPGDEIHIMEIEIKTRADGWHPINDFAKAVFEAYTYPLLLIVAYKDEYCLFSSVSHSNSRDHDKNVAEKIQGSGWISNDNRKGYDPPEDYYMMETVHFGTSRDLEKQTCSILFDGESISSIMAEWYALFRQDRAQWSYFYHMSDEYSKSDSIIGSIISRSKRIEQIYDEGATLFDTDLPGMEEDFWFEEEDTIN